jgi:hypothetical protein
MGDENISKHNKKIKVFKKTTNVKRHSEKGKYYFNTFITNSSFESQNITLLCNTLFTVNEQRTK